MLPLSGFTCDYRVIYNLYSRLAGVAPGHGAEAVVHEYCKLSLLRHFSGKKKSVVAPGSFKELFSRIPF